MTSIVRQRLAQMLLMAGKLTAYDAHKHYIRLFSATTRRNVYYQLRKGVDLGIFNVVDVVEETGDYSWGVKARKVYYGLLLKEGVLPIERIRKHFMVKK